MNKDQRIELARKSLKGVSIGDAFGESFFGETNTIEKCIREKIMPQTSWEFTDDTVMSIAVYEQLEKNGTINQNDLAKQFSIKHKLDPNRGYGATARRILRAIEEGENWRKISREAFDGMGSMGNGASMRVSPIGAYFYDDLDKVKELAKNSAEVTHSNIEGITGAIAVSIATAITTKNYLHNQQIEPNEYIKLIVEELPETDLKAKINKSISIPYSYHTETVKSILGNGVKILAKDTVPFSIWCAAHNQNNFENALWKAVSILGDRDTICAIVGGITIMGTEEKELPEKWLSSVEDIENSIFRENSR
jgi:ADP-ribosylglycohydrolase